MYTVIHIENEKELIAALDKTPKQVGDKSPTIQKVELMVDLVDNDYQLICDDPRFNIQKVDPLRLVTKVLLRHGIELRVVDSIEKPDQKGVIL